MFYTTLYHFQLGKKSIQGALLQPCPKNVKAKVRSEVTLLILLNLN